MNNLSAGAEGVSVDRPSDLADAMRAGVGASGPRPEPTGNWGELRPYMAFRKSRALADAAALLRAEPGVW